MCLKFIFNWRVQKAKPLDEYIYIFKILIFFILFSTALFVLLCLRIVQHRGYDKKFLDQSFMFLLSNFRNTGLRKFRKWSLFSQPGFLCFYILTINFRKRYFGFGNVTQPGLRTAGASDAQCWTFLDFVLQALAIIQLNKTMFK